MKKKKQNGKSTEFIDSMAADTNQLYIKLQIIFSPFKFALFKPKYAAQHINTIEYCTYIPFAQREKKKFVLDCFFIACYIKFKCQLKLWPKVMRSIQFFFFFVVRVHRYLSTEFTYVVIKMNYDYFNLIN